MSMFLKEKIVRDIFRDLIIVIKTLGNTNNRLFSVNIINDFLYSMHPHLSIELIEGFVLSEASLIKHLFVPR